MAGHRTRERFVPRPAFLARLGAVTVDGHQVLIAVLTQHDESYQGGVERVETLVRAAVAAVHP